MANPIVWADIPCADLQRAMKFYGHVTGREMTTMEGMPEIGLFPPDEDRMDSVSADLYLGGTPSHEGVTVYLGSGGDIDGMLSRVSEAGGRILEQKQFRGDMIGWIAFIEDSEGNRVGIQEPGKSA